MKKKYLDGRHWSRGAKYTYEYESTTYGELKGYMSRINIHSVTERRVIQQGDLQICLCDEGYQGIIFLPDESYWAATAIYDQGGKLVEWYFDMTYCNSIDEDGVPYFEDLYLDIAVTPTFIPRILDQDELSEAMEAQRITKDQYDRAYKTCLYVLKEVITDKVFMLEFMRGNREK